MTKEGPSKRLTEGGPSKANGSDSGDGEDPTGNRERGREREREREREGERERERVRERECERECVHIVHTYCRLWKRQKEARNPGMRKRSSVTKGGEKSWYEKKKLGDKRRRETLVCENRAR